LEGEAGEAAEAGESGDAGTRGVALEGASGVAGGAAGAGLAAGGWVACCRCTNGVSVCGRVARWAAAGSVGRNNGPRWPQPATAAMLAARAIVLTRIWEALNIIKL